MSYQRILNKINEKLEQEHSKKQNRHNLNVDIENVFRSLKTYGDEKTYTIKYNNFYPYDTIFVKVGGEFRLDFIKGKESNTSYQELGYKDLQDFKNDHLANLFREIARIEGVSVDDV